MGSDKHQKPESSLPGNVSEMRRAEFRKNPVRVLMENAAEMLTVFFWVACGLALAWLLAAGVLPMVGR